MIYRRSPEFKKGHKGLPKHIQDKVDKAFVLFRENPRHPSLGVKKVQGIKGVWEGRIDDFYRFTFEYQKDPTSDETICLFRNIGSHDIVKTAP